LVPALACIDLLRPRVSSGAGDHLHVILSSTSISPAFGHPMVLITTLRQNGQAYSALKTPCAWATGQGGAAFRLGHRSHQQWFSSTQGCLQECWVVSLDTDLLSDVMDPQDAWVLQSRGRQTSDVPSRRPTPHHTTLK
jgi:hypothetical protein